MYGVEKLKVKLGIKKFFSRLEIILSVGEISFVLDYKIIFD